MEWHGIRINGLKWIGFTGPIASMGLVYNSLHLPHTKNQPNTSHIWMVWGLFFQPDPTTWWFQTLFIFTPTWGNDPIWLIFFKWVETTNQPICRDLMSLHFIHCFFGSHLSDCEVVKSFRRLFFCFSGRFSLLNIQVDLMRCLNQSISRFLTNYKKGPPNYYKWIYP